MSTEPSLGMPWTTRITEAGELGRTSHTRVSSQVHMDDEDPVDPKAACDAHCAATVPCAMLMVKYEECQARIAAKGSGTCTGQFMDFTHCVDACASGAVMKGLK